MNQPMRRIALTLAAALLLAAALPAAALPTGLSPGGVALLWQAALDWLHGAEPASGMFPAFGGRSEAEGSAGGSAGATDKNGRSLAPHGGPGAWPQNGSEVAADAAPGVSDQNGSHWDPFG